MEKGRLGYVFDDGTIQWAEKRSLELLKGTEFIKYQLEKLKGVGVLLNQAAHEMWNQPESEMVLDYVRQLDALTISLEDTMNYWSDDQKEIEKGIRSFMRMKRDGYIR